VATALLVAVLTGPSGDGMAMIGWMALVAAAAWVTAPWVSMARHGTVDARTVAGWRGECAVPAPRRAPDDAPARERTA
jgi:hypothetical protein